ncbi:unnamed protein product [Cunninghamella blakesleeana]
MSSTIKGGGKNKYLNFKDYFCPNSTLTEEVLKSIYLNCLKSILNDRKTSASKKPLIKELIEKAHQTTADHPTATIINNNFNKGTLIQNNNVNNSQPVPDCFKNNTLVTLQQPEEVNNSTNNKHHQNKKQKTDVQVVEEDDQYTHRN